jgi:Vam6/Vps39-like protein vacuolar protein sorting-associated protein 39
MREEEKFSKRPIQQLAIIKEANILVSLSDAFVSLHDLQTYELQERLDKSKGATLFAATSNIVKDDSTGIPSIVSRIAVAVKRKILLWSWHDMEFDQESAEVVLVSAGKSLTWASGTRLVAGLDSGFVMIDIETLAISDISKPGSLEDASTKFGAVSSSGMGYVGMGSWVPKPMATKLAEGEMLLAKDVNTLFINADGKALEKRQVPWPAAPDAIGYSYPYMLVLQPPSKGTLEVRNPDTLTLLQSISLPNASLLHVPQPNISLAHAGKGFLVGSDRCIWRMSALNYNSQIEQLTTESHYDEAISLVSMLEDTLLLDKEVKLRDIKTLKAQALFTQRKYRESLELFAEAPAPPQRVVSMYPRIISGEPAAESDPDDADGQDDSKDDKKSPPASPKVQPRKTMLGRLMPEHKKPDAETASVKSSRTSDTAEAGSIRGRLADGSAEKPLEGRDLLVATNELCAFLAQIRVRLQKIINVDGSLIEPLPTHPPEGYKPPFHKLILITPDDETPIDWHAKLLEVATLVYTTLFRAYMFAKPGLAGSLFRLDNFCDPTVVRDKLYETGRYADLIDFLHGKKLHREALELLVKFGKDVDNEAVIPALRGPRRTVAYLQQLPPAQIDLVLEFAEWPLRTDAELGMEVFLADTENAETLPRDRVLSFLQGIGDRLVVKYLEHIIGELNDLTPDFHQRLIEQYLERLKLGRTAKPEYGGFANEEEKNTLKEKLQNFLISSDQYNRARAFREIPADGMSILD